MSKNSKVIFKITLTAILSAIAFVLQFVEFPIPIMPAFIKFDISDLPAIFGAFAIGPLSGVIIELLKNILHILLKGTSSAFIGELCNFLMGASCALTAGLIYKYNKNRKGGIIAALAGAFVMGVISLPINYFIVYPAYVKFYNMPLDAIIQMYCDIFAPVKSTPTSNPLFNCLLIFNLPFTFCKGLIDAIICIIIYKPLSKALKGKFM